MNKKIFHIKASQGLNVSLDTVITIMNESMMDDLDTLFEILPEARIKANIEAARILNKITESGNA